MRFGIGWRLGAGFAVVLVLTIASTIYGQYELSRLSGAQAELAATLIPMAMTTYDVRTANNRVTSGILEYLQAKERTQREPLRKELSQTWNRLETDLDKLQSMRQQFARPEDSQILDRMEAALAENRKLQGEIIQLADSGGRRGRERAARLLGERGLALCVQLRKAANELQGDIMKDVDDNVKTMSAAGESTARALRMGPLLALLAGVAIAIAMAKALAKGIRRVLGRAQEVAGGELSRAELEVRSDDEVGELTRAVNHLQQNLRTTLESIASGAERLASASEEISSNATQAAAGAQKQSDQTTQVATAMQEMTATIAQMTEHARQAAEAASQTATVAKQGGSVVRQTLEIMGEIAKASQEAGGRMEMLGQNSQQIGTILSAIEDIADQTNLLALNAAIEAARAGEQGRGFAVVASEVRKLAEKTTAATQQIASMIAAIQSGITTAMEAMQLSEAKVRVGREKTESAGGALEKIIAAADRENEMISQMATAVTEQSSTSEEISRSVQEMAAVVHQSGEGAKQSAIACSQLSELALNLQQTVGKFHLGETRRRPGERAKARAAHA